MVDLLEKYTIVDLIIFIPLLALAIRGAISFYDWAHDRIKKTADKKFSHQQGFESLKKNIDDLKVADEKNQKQIDQINQQYIKLQDQIQLLIKSDIINLRSQFVEKYHYFINQGYIDDISMMCLEDLYAIYKNEGGNYFVQDLMAELRTLPKSSSSLSLMEKEILSKEREKES